MTLLRHIESTRPKNIGSQRLKYFFSCAPFGHLKRVATEAERLFYVQKLSVHYVEILRAHMILGFCRTNLNTTFIERLCHVLRPVGIYVCKFSW